MFDSIHDINTCTGISVRLTQTGMRVSAIRVTRKGKQLDLDKRLKDKQSLAAVAEELPSGSIVSLNISGKGVLHKDVSAEPQDETQGYARLVPGAAAEDFYFQSFHSGDQRYVSFIRRTEADALIAALSKKGLRVVMLSLGAFPVASVTGQMNQYGEEIVFDGHEIRVSENGDWLAYKLSEAAANPYPVKLGLEVIDEQLLIPYAAAFQALLYDRIDAAVAQADAVIATMDTVRKTASLKKKGVLVLVIAFVLLFANTLYFMHLNSENGRLQDELSLQSTQSSDIDALASKTARSEQLIRSIGYDRSASKSVILDQASALMPDQITLSSVKINPVTTGRSGSRSATLYLERQLWISGNCASILPVNEWLARLRSLKWLKRAELKDYGLGDEENKGAFTIIINF